MPGLCDALDTDNDGTAPPISQEDAAKQDAWNREKQRYLPPVTVPLLPGVFRRRRVGYRQGNPSGASEVAPARRAEIERAIAQSDTGVVNGGDGFLYFGVPRRDR